MVSPVLFASLTQLRALLEHAAPAVSVCLSLQAMQHSPKNQQPWSTRLRGFLALLSLSFLLPPEQTVHSLMVGSPILVSCHRWDPHVRRSRVGQKLSDLTSQRVIVLILTMLIMIPGFNWNSGLYGGYDSIFDGGLSMLHDGYLANGNTTGFRLVRILCYRIPCVSEQHSL